MRATAQPVILFLELLQPLHLVTLQATELLAPPVIRKLRHADPTDRFSDRTTLRQQNIDLAQLRHDLFGFVLLLGHSNVLVRLNGLLQAGQLFRGQTKEPRRCAQPRPIDRAPSVGCGKRNARNPAALAMPARGRASVQPQARQASMRYGPRRERPASRSFVNSSAVSARAASTPMPLAREHQSSVGSSISSMRRALWPKSLTPTLRISPLRIE